MTWTLAWTQCLCTGNPSGIISGIVTGSGNVYIGGALVAELGSFECNSNIELNITANVTSETVMASIDENLMTELGEGNTANQQCQQ